MAHWDPLRAQEFEERLSQEWFDRWQVALEEKQNAAEAKANKDIE